MLLEKCICGRKDGNPIWAGGMFLLDCECGVIRYATQETPEQYQAQYKTGAYHKSSDRHKGCVPYDQRYVHDLEVALTRIKRYGEVLNGRTHNLVSVLDVGCANGAFVDAVAENDMQGWGIDLNLVGSPRRHCRAADIHHLPEDFPKSFDLITYHDVLEHVIDPRAELLAAWKLAARGGVIVVDVPDISTEAGLHHVKPEHLWYFSERTLKDLIWDCGFKPLYADTPIPGKLVVYGEAR